MGVEECMLSIYQNCCNNCASFEIWDGYYKMRYDEFTKYQLLFPKKHFSNTLEIGCGIGYQSAFLSCVSDQVVASDVDLGDMVKHSRGLDITREFIAATGINSISVVNANAESLPFADGSFDFIYSSYAFQYVPDKVKALAEIQRVLRPGGHFFCVLPSIGNRINAVKGYYKAVLKKIPAYLFSKQTKTVVNAANDSKSEHNVTVRKRTRLLPPPDDESNSFLKELVIYRPGSWRKLFTQNGHTIVMEKNSGYIDDTNKKTGFINNFREQLGSNGCILVTKK